MSAKPAICMHCGKEIPEGEGQHWIPQHAAMPFMETKHLKEPIAGLRCRQCRQRGRYRLYILAVVILILIVFVIDKLI